MSHDILKSIKVLIVEDEDIIRQKTEASLQYIVGEVVAKSNGQEALEALKTYKPDLIITDLEMPIMGGVELIKKIRQHDKNTCIMVFTAHTSEKYLIELIDMHIEKYIVKPINFDKIMEALQEASEVIQKQKSHLQILPKEYQYSWDSKELLYQKEAIKLTKKEMLFLELLLAKNHTIVNYSEIENSVWEDSVMTENALRSMVRNLRKKLPKDFIQNHSGLGYKIV